VLGDTAQALIIESHRSTQTRSLLAYNTTLLRTLVRESHSLSDALVAAAEAFGSQLDPDAGTEAELTISALALQRNMRAALVYHQQRIDVLKDKYWEKGGVLSASFGAETDTRRNMATVDEGFAKAYADLCLTFKESWYGNLELDGDDDRPVQLLDAIDLLGGGVDAPPPRDLFVSVRVLRDVGDVETASGARLSLSKGSQYHVNREDVETLLVQGYLELVD